MTEQDMLVKRINYLCREKKMTYCELAEASGIPVTTLMNVVNKSTVNPGLLILERLCAGLGITLNEFFDAPEFMI